MPAGTARARLTYDPLIPVLNRRALNFSYKIRTIDAHSIVMVADFFDTAEKPIEASRISITKRVTSEFTRQSVRFQIPRRAKTVRLSIEFGGKITACTFCAPEASLV